MAGNRPPAGRGGKRNRQIAAISTSRHTFLCMFSWGSGSTGVLAHGDEKYEDAKCPVEATALQSVCNDVADITQIATSGRHALIVTNCSQYDTTQVWAWGDNEYQQCGGTDIAIMCSTPQRLLSVPARVSRVSCGWFHSALLTQDGSMFTWGCNQQYQLGLGDSIIRDRPTRVTLDHVDTRLRIAEVSLGWTHSNALCSDGRVLTFGTNQAGQLGVGDTEPRKLPTLVSFSDVPVVAVRAGWKHSVFLSENGQVWCSGSNQYGQLAKPVAVRQSRKLATPVVNVDGAITHSCIPVLIPVQDCIKISSGWHHVVALDHNNRVWAWGRNNFGQCGTGSYDSPIISPSEILIPPNNSDDEVSRSPASDVICGSEHTIVVDPAGHVGACGWNEHGNLGFGNTLNQSLITWIPGIGQRIDQSERTEILQIAKCSSGSFLIASGGAATLAAVINSSIQQ